MPATIKFTNFVFTVNNYAEDSIEMLQAIDLFKYCVVGKEVGEEGTPHLQGYVQLVKRTRASVVNAAILTACGNAPHTERARGDWKSNYEYCTKDGDFVEWGAPTKKKGERTDIKEFMAAAEEKTDLDLAREYPLEYAKYHKAASIIRKASAMEDEKKALKAQMEVAVLKTWQLRAIAYLRTQDDRKVLWYVDPEGGHGKTFLAKWLMVMRDAFYVQGGAHKDIAFAYGGEEIVIFDLTRDKEELCSYSMIESFKNGTLFSAKYESTVKVKAAGCKVIVFSNWEPDQAKLSADRWMIKHLPETDPWTLSRGPERVQRLSDDHFADIPDLVPLPVPEEAPEPPHPRDLWAPAKRSREEMEDEWMSKWQSQPRDSFDWSEMERERRNLMEDFSTEDGDLF